MATGVAPRDEDNLLTRSELETIKDAMKQKKFRDMLAEYCEEVSDPANRELYQKEMTQLEKERGYDVTFINPKGGYVIKTSVAGDRKAFINICSNENIAKPSYKMEVVDGRRGMNWQIPYSIIPPREDYNTKKKEKCVVYDVVYHPDTLRMAAANKEFRELVNKTAIDGLQKAYNIHFDSNNYRFPKSQYKGGFSSAVIRKEDPDFKPPNDDEEDETLTPEMINKLYPQRMFQKQKDTQQQKQEEHSQEMKKTRKGKTEFTHATENGYTIPKYVIKQQKSVDLQDYTYHKDSKQYCAIPSSIVVEVNLPMLSSTKECTLDVHEKSFYLISEKPAKYKLDITLPYAVDDNCGNAQFDKSKKMLVVTLPVIRRHVPSASSETSNNNDNFLKIDSGVESEENSGSQSEDDTPKEKLIVELSSTTEKPIDHHQHKTKNIDSYSKPFLDTSLAYSLPNYTYNVLDEIIAFTFHVKNTEPDSVVVKKDNNKISIKFTSVGSGFVPVHYAAVIEFTENVAFDNVTGEAWDNNVILQLEISGDIPEKFQIGLSDESMTTELIDISQVKKVSKSATEKPLQYEEDTLPTVEVTNLGSETNIVVSSNDLDELDEDDIESPTSKDEVTWSEPSSDETETKGILRKPINFARSFSESSAGDIASSIDYISSDCIPEESSLKKTVRFSNVIARQFYRHNSSIEGQKKKNQRKKSKKRSQDRRKSESEAEEDGNNSSDASQPKKSVLKKRHDSGLADTSDAEGEFKNSPSEVKQLKFEDKNFEGVMKETENHNRKHIDDHLQERHTDSEINEQKGNDENVTKDAQESKSLFDIVDNLDEDDDNVFNNDVNSNVEEANNQNKYDEVTNGDDVDNNNLTDNAQGSKSPFNILNHKENPSEKPEPLLRECEDSKTNKTNKNRDKPVTSENIKHNTNLYDPERLNKGQYLEVQFKNDLIFDLDM